MTMIIQIIQMSVGCQLGDLPTSVRVLSSTSTMLAALQVDAQRSTSFYFKSNVPLFKGRYDFIHPLYICGSAHPNVSDNGVINLPQYLEDDGLNGPLICAWDFVLNRDNRKVPANETTTFDLHIEISNVLNLTEVTKRSQCGDGNYVQVAVPGIEMPLLLLCSRNEMKLKEGFDDAAHFMKDQPSAVHDHRKTAEFTTTVPLVVSKLPYQKAVVMVKLNNLKIDYGVKITWTGMNRN